MTASVLREMQPLHVTPESPVFTSTIGGPIDPKRFGALWGDALRGCAVRARGLYSTKDTFVSLALRVRGPLWVERQTGVAYATLRKHYAKWMPQDDDRSELARLSVAFGVTERVGVEIVPPKRGRGGQFAASQRKARVSEVPGAGLEPARGRTPTEF